MSNPWDDMMEDAGDGDIPSLETEEGRDEWIEFLLEQDGDQNGEWATALVVHEGSGGENMVARFRWPDGREEIYDLIVRRSMEVVAAKDKAGSN